MAELLDDDAFLRSLSRDERAQPFHPPRWDLMVPNLLASTDAADPCDLSIDQGFRGFTAPISAEAARRFRDKVHDHPLLDSAALADAFREQLDKTLQYLVERTMVLELNVARLRGRLRGKTSVERFRDFVAGVGDPHLIRATWQEYPVLLRSLIRVAENREDALLALVDDLASDHAALLDMFFAGADQGRAVRVEMGLGDSHCRGRTVSTVTFASGAQVVYKPRSLAVDSHFYELLNWLNGKNPAIQLRPLKIVCRNDHGWMEFVAYKACHSIDELHRFYQRQGAWLALFYALRGTDIHRENLIACGEHPLVVDLESLFHPRLPRYRGKPGLFRAFAETLDESVVATGFLPAPLTGAQFDLSALAGRNRQMTPHRVLQWRDASTDEWHYVREPVELSWADHSPQLEGEPAEVARFIDDVMFGFRTCYQVLLRHRDELMHPLGLLTRFRDDRVRVIIRSTQVYGVLLQESYHPDMLRDALERDQLFDELRRPSENEPFLSEVVPEEQQDLRQGDIPVFTTTPGSRDLWTSTEKCLPAMLSEPSLSSVHKRLHQLGETDLAQQSWLVEATLAVDAVNAGRTYTRRITAADKKDEDNPLELAVELGERLRRQSFERDGTTFWLTVGRVGAATWRIEPCGMDLYSGLPGIALFFAYLGKLSGDAGAIELSRATVRTILGEDSCEGLSGIGLFTGIGGVVYTLSHLGLLWNDDELLKAAKRLAEAIEPMVDSDEDFDIVDGSAGCIVALLPLLNATKSERLLKLLTQLGHRLIKCAVPQDKGVGWRIRLEPERSLAGMAHGAAGIAWALLELWAVTGFAPARDTALLAIEYERSLFSPDEGNWRDLREDRMHLRGGNTSKFMASWCHGAPGIGMARIASLQRFPIPGAREEIDVALETTRRYGFGGNHCLCHGDLGNLDLLLHARDELGDNIDIAPLTIELAQRISRAPQCGIPLHVEPPGLMLGLAGLGLGLLRLVDSNQVPSVLVAGAPI